MPFYITKEHKHKCKPSARYILLDQKCGISFAGLKPEFMKKQDRILHQEQMFSFIEKWQQSHQPRHLFCREHLFCITSVWKGGHLNCPGSMYRPKPVRSSWSSLMVEGISIEKFKQRRRYFINNPALAS